jgi:hypothetical protein
MKSKGRKAEMPGGIRTVEDFVHMFNEFLDEEDPMTPEEVDADLREAGFDVETVGAEMEAVAERALAESPWNWRNRAQQLEDERARFERVTTALQGSREDIVRAIQQLLAQLGSRARVAYAHFRNFESATEEDLVSLLSELEYLASRQSAQTKKDEN